MKTILAMRLAAVTAALAMLPAMAAGPGGGVLGPGTPTRASVWEARLRVVHHAYDLGVVHTTYVAVSGASLAECDDALYARADQLSAAEPTAQVDVDHYCVRRH